MPILTLLLCCEQKVVDEKKVNCLETNCPEWFEVYSEVRESWLEAGVVRGNNSKDFINVFKDFSSGKHRMGTAEFWGKSEEPKDIYSPQFIVQLSECLKSKESSNDLIANLLLALNFELPKEEIGKMLDQLESTGEVDKFTIEFLVIFNTWVIMADNDRLGDLN